MFETSHRILVLDTFRIPFRQVATPPIEGVCVIHADGRFLAWTRGGHPEREFPLAHCSIAGVHLPLRLAPEADVRANLALLGGTWESALPVCDETGARLGAVWREAGGSLFLPFDPDDVVECCLSESYATDARSGWVRAKRRTIRAYYRARPILPRGAQIWLRRRFSRIQARTRFPRWPVEPCLHDLYDLVLGWLADIAMEPVVGLSAWPAGKSWALVLTHDVETSDGYRSTHLLRGIEVAAGYRSSWNMVPKRYVVDDSVVAELTSAGFEVGVHGLYHDGRDLESSATLGERLPEIRAWAQRWGAVGFRSPATHRRWDLMPLLGFDYDSSSPDTDPFEPQGGGCCTWLPFFNGELVELPITLVQDHTLFVILGRTDETAWVEKTEYIRKRGGLVTLITHPDYMLSDDRLDAYERFLRRYASDDRAWRVLPRDVSSWWRRRAASHLERSGSAWVVVGPAAGEASVVELARPRAR